jgi:uncharacterized Zn-binding protein involved in type VI secretion
MPAIAVEGSTVATGHLCDTTTTLDTPSQSKVFAGGKLIACLGDLTVTHLHKVGLDCVPHIASITGYSSTVSIGGKGVARVNDACDEGTITSGASSVSIGG